MTAEKTGVVNLQVKDRDPQKQAYFASLLREDAAIVLPIWRSFGLMRKTMISAQQASKDAQAGHTVRAIENTPDTEYVRRAHNAQEHMIAGKAAYVAVAERIVANGYLTPIDVRVGGRAFLLHDSGKELEVLLVNGARGEQGTGVVDRVLANSTVQVGAENQDRLAQLRQEYEDRFNSESVGVRAIAGYDLASDVNELRLAHAGVDPRTIEIQKEAAFTSCPTIEVRVDTFNNQTPDEQKETIQMAILHWCDDVFTNDRLNPNVVEQDGQRLNAIDTRTIAVFDPIKNPRNAVLDEAWRTDPRSTNGEGAADMQRRVGHKVEKFLADLAGVEDSLTLPAVAAQAIEQNILNH